MAKRIWVAKMNCQMPFRDFVKGEEIELDDENVTARIKALFDCRDKEEKAEADADFKVMVARLKAAKIPIPRGSTKEKVKELFDTFLVKGALASNIVGEEKKEEEKPDAPTEGADAAPADTTPAPAEEKKEEATAEEKPAEEKPADGEAKGEAKK
jgi:hypothetical protein